MIRPEPPPPPPPRRKKLFVRSLRYVGVALASTLLATLAINAGDNVGNMSASLLGTLMGKKTQTESRCPIGMVFVENSFDGFCIDQFENSIGANCPRSSSNSQLDTKENLDTEGCGPVSEEGKLPWVNISQNQAALACAKAGKRLPTNKEWYEAALGTPDPEYGLTSEDCAISKKGLSSPLPTGNQKKCVSSRNAYDMIGNAWEWVDGTIFDGTYENRALPDEGFVRAVDSQGIPTETDPKEKDPNYGFDYFWLDKTGARAMFRGGFWGTESEGGLYAVHAFSPPSFIGVAVGFRCVR